MSEAALKIKRPQGAYPERIDPRLGWFDRAGSRLVGPFLRWSRSVQRGSERFVADAASLEPWAQSLPQEKIPETAAQLGAQMRQDGFIDPIAARSFALIREVAGRTIGQRHFDVQLIGGRILLHGLVAEMETGEGKTLTATLAASSAALAGLPVHIITVNDYLAKRDAELMGPVYKALGLTVSTVIHGMTPEERRAAYSADVTYCTNKEITFDYLKDRIVLGREAGRVQLQVERLFETRPRLDQLLLRGLFYGIVDEADSVLVDEARTPLIISGGSVNDTSEEDVYRTALEIATHMEKERDFIIEDRDRTVVILPEGLERLTDIARPLGGVWTRRRWREELVRQALAAHHLFINEKQYLVVDGKVQIIDEFTGRIMEDRSWEHGLHQMIEVKESCPTTMRNDPLARISYQRFFRRYLRLAGMTGTAREVRHELWSVYKLATKHVPTNRPSRRQQWPTQIYGTEAEKWETIAGRIAEIHKLGRPVLVGTRSVEASEHLSRLLTSRDLPHQLLNARQDSDEAMIVAQAGQQERITVATNMAGRGTDIQLGPGVRDLGGLHVIATELHEARRIDRQLFGRCARQGDPGTCEAIISVQDELSQVYSPRLWRALESRVLSRGHIPRSRARSLAIQLAQRSAERRNLQMRRDLLKMDEKLDSALAFSGKSE